MGYLHECGMYSTFSLHYCKSNKHGYLHRALTKQSNNTPHGVVVIKLYLYSRVWVQIPVQAAMKLLLQLKQQQ